MKLKEKLACEYAEKNPPNLLVGQTDPTIQSYLAGMEKMRELAANQVRMEPYMPPEANCLELRIKYLGEEEVK